MSGRLVKEDFGEISSGGSFRAGTNQGESMPFMLKASRRIREISSTEDIERGESNDGWWA
jgi:hypothetical protein